MSALLDDLFELSRIDAGTLAAVSWIRSAAEDGSPRAVAPTALTATANGVRLVAEDGCVRCWAR